MYSNYIRGENGTRGLESIVNTKYHMFVEKIVTEMAKRYGNSGNVIGWQLNNEPPAIPDYSPSSQEAFRQWLKNRSKPPEVIRQPKLLLLQERNEYRRTNRFIPVNLSFLPTENIPFFSIWEAWEINILLP